MTDCVFCEIVAGRLPAHVVHEDDRVLAFLDIHPLTPGHTLIIPKRHVPFLADLDQETADRLFSVTRLVAAALRASHLRCEGVNLFLSDGAAAGQEVFHTHMHVFPRFAGDALGPGRPFGQAPSPGDPEEMAAIAARLRTVQAAEEPSR
jgi:histidine triad (HIT) family protein